MSELNELSIIYEQSGKVKSSPNELLSTIQSKLNLTFVGRGGNRLVVGDQTYVYKLPISSTGYKQNSQSYQRYTKLHPNKRDTIVAPIKVFDNGILKQKLCPITSNINHRKDLENKIDEYGYIYQDWNNSDVGIYRGNPVLVDIAGLKPK